MKIFKRCRCFNPPLWGSGGDKQGLQTQKNNLWFEVISTSIVWQIQYCCCTLWIKELFWLLYICKTFFCRHYYSCSLYWYCCPWKWYQDIFQLKSYLSCHFYMKDIGLLRYFLGIEVTRSPKGLFLSQRKYITGFLSEH